jgi:hypothetical protein
MVPPEPPAGADAGAELPAEELPAGALELGDDEDAKALDDELEAALDDELPAALEDELPAVLDDEQAAREPATAIAMHAVITVRRVVEERATLILPGVEF